MYTRIGSRMVAGGCVALFLVGSLGFAQGGGVAVSAPLKHQHVTIPNTELRTIYSHIVNQEFSIYVQQYLDIPNENYSGNHRGRHRVPHYEHGRLGGGGLFVLYSLFTHPETFRLYFAGSPSLEYDENVIFKHEREFSASGKGLNAKIFLSAGSLEDSSTIRGVKVMSEILESHYRPTAHVSSQVFEGEDHRSCMAVAIMRALRVLYGR